MIFKDSWLLKMQEPGKLYLGFGSGTFTDVRVDGLIRDS